MYKAIRNNKIFKYVMIGILTCLNIFAFTETLSLQGKLTGSTNLLGPIILLFLIPKLIFCFWKIKEKRKIVVSSIGGILFSFAYVVGMYLHYKNRLPRTIEEAIFLCFLVIAFSILCIPIMAIILDGFTKVAIWYETKKREQKLKYKPSTIFFLAWGIIFVSWLPTFLANWPGNFIFDAKYQIQEVINLNFHTHHPLIHTYIMGLFYKLGVSIGDASLGFSFYTLLQMFVLSFSGGVVISYFYKKQTPKVLWLGYLFFYAIVPVHSIFAVTATKDVLFAAFFLLFTVYIFSWFLDKNEFTLWQWVGFLTTGILMTLFRNNAVFALILAAPFFIFFSNGKERKKKMLFSMIGIVFGFFFVNLLMITSLHAYSNDPLKESFSVPIQQMARVVSYRAEDLSPELQREITTYIPLENIENYNPYLADSVKNAVDELLLRKDLKNFLKLWVQVGLKFPGEYIASFMANTMGFWYPGDTEYAVCEGIAAYHTLIGTKHELVKNDYSGVYGIVNSYLFTDMNYRTIPILSQLFKPVLYFWIILLGVLNAIYRKKKRNIVPLVFIITYFLSVFLGPFATLRYVYCVVVCLPFLTEIVFTTRN